MYYGHNDDDHDEEKIQIMTETSVEVSSSSSLSMMSLKICAKSLMRINNRVFDALLSSTLYDAKNESRERALEDFRKQRPSGRIRPDAMRSRFSN